MWTPDIVIYHHPCADGFGAAWACHRAWPHAVFIPANYGDTPPDVDGKRVLIVDFSYKYDVLRQLGTSAHSIVILDHHKTALADLADFTWHEPQSLADFRAEVNAARWPLFDEQIRIMAYFDMNRSGARLAWQFANPKSRIPDLIRLIEDRDLWRFALPESRAFATWLRTQPQTFEDWDDIYEFMKVEWERESILREARTVQTYHDLLVEQLARDADIQRIDQTDVPVVNCPGLFASDVGHELLKQHPGALFVATWSVHKGLRKYSLRSDDARCDVSVIAAKFGGGGHRNAAGFTNPTFAGGEVQL